MFDKLYASQTLFYTHIFTDKLKSSHLYCLRHPRTLSFVFFRILLKHFHELTDRSIKNSPLNEVREEPLLTFGHGRGKYRHDLLRTVTNENA